MTEFLENIHIICYIIKKSEVLAMKDLKESRRMIDEIDEQLIKLFEKRMETISDVAAYKLENGMSVLDSKREEDVLNRNIARVSEKWQPYYREFQESLFSVSRKYQKYRQSIILKNKDSINRTLFFFIIVPPHI